MVLIINQLSIVVVIVVEELLLVQKILSGERSQQNKNDAEVALQDTEAKKEKLISEVRASAKTRK